MEEIKAYRTSDGRTFLNEAKAKAHEQELEQLKKRRVYETMVTFEVYCYTTFTSTDEEYNERLNKQIDWFEAFMSNGLDDVSNCNDYSIEYIDSKILSTL